MINNENQLSLIGKQIVLLLQENYKFMINKDNIEKIIDNIINNLLDSNNIFVFDDVNKLILKIYICNFILENNKNDVNLYNWAFNFVNEYKNDFLNYNLINNVEDFNNIINVINKKIELKNFNIKKYALDNIPVDFTMLQKAKLIYNRINDVLVYDPIGIYVETSEIDLLNIKLKDRKVDINCLESTYGVCYDWSKIFSQLLSELGIKNSIIFASFHGFVVFEIDNHYYFADATKVFEELTDLARSANYLISTGFFEIDKKTYDNFFEYPEEMSQGNQIKFMNIFKNQLHDLDNSIGYDLYTTSELFCLNQSFWDLYSDKYELSNIVSEAFVVDLLKKFIFPFIICEDIVAGYTWSCELIKNIFPKNISSSISSNMYYNIQNKKTSVAFKIKLKNKITTYFYEDGYDDFMVVTSKDIKKSGYNRIL